MSPKPPASPPASRKDLMDFFAAEDIEVTTVDHKAVFTVEESRTIKADMPGGHTKNLFLKDKKGVVILISAKDETAIDLKTLHKRLGCGRLSFGKPQLMLERLGVTPGSVTAFALINDPRASVRFIIDAALIAMSPINFHPLENTATTAITPEDFLKFARACGHEPQIMDFSPTPEQEAAKP